MKCTDVLQGLNSCSNERLHESMFPFLLKRCCNNIYAYLNKVVPRIYIKIFTKSLFIALCTKIPIIKIMRRFGRRCYHRQARSECQKHNLNVTFCFVVGRMFGFDLAMTSLEKFNVAVQKVKVLRSICNSAVFTSSQSLLGFETMPLIN